MFRSIRQRLLGTSRRNSRPKAGHGLPPRRLIFESLECRALLAATISDSSFEVPGLTAGKFEYTPNGSPWQFGQCTGISNNGSAFTSGNPNAPDGNQVAIVQNRGVMNQSVYMDAGTYNISMQAAQRANQSHYQQIEVLVDGTCVGTLTPSTICYGSYQTSNFTVKAGTHLIQLAGLNPKGGGNTVFLDDVAISGSSGISDGTFGAPAVGTSTFANTPDGSPWQFGAGTGVSNINSAFTSNNPQAPNGGQVAFIQRGGSMSQSVYLAAGTYSLMFQAAQRAGQPSNQEIQVLVDGAQVGTATPASTSYSSYQTSNFTVKAGMHSIRFTGLNPQGGANTGFLDDVAITSATSVGTSVSDGISDGTFEVPSLNANTFRYSPDGSPWNFAACTGISSNGSAFTDANPASPDPNGIQVAFIQNGGSMSQSVYLAAGSYNISMQAAQRYGQSSLQEIEVSVDGANVGAITPTSTNYGLYQTGNFMVKAGIHIIRFTGLNPHGGANTAFIDEVAIAGVTGISDGGFETPALVAATYMNAPAGSPWLFGTDTGVSSNNSAITSSNPVSPDPGGTQVAFIQRGGGMTQSAYLAAGTYYLSMEAAQRTGNPSYQEIEVLVDGHGVGTITPNSTSYNGYQTLNFTVQTGMHTILLVGLNPKGGANTAFLDEVAITQAAGISDGSFELPQLAADAYVYSPNGSPWQFAANTGVSSNGSAFTSGNPNAPDGSQVAFIQDGGSMNQSAYLTAGTYSLSFMAAQRAGQTNYQEIEVYVDGTAVGTVTPSGTSYGSYQTQNFTVKTGLHTIQFLGLNPKGGANTAFIDEVTIT